VLETRTNNTTLAATGLSFTEDPPGMKSTAGRGLLSSGSDVDYWSFAGTAGDLFDLATFVPGSPDASQLHYRVLNPDGSLWFDFYPSYNGDGQSPTRTFSRYGNIFPGRLSEL